MRELMVGWMWDMNKQQASKKPRGRSSLVRRVIVLLAGGILVAIGLVMLVLPGPAIVFIPLGLAILATEFRWAKNWLTATRQWIRSRFKNKRQPPGEP
jgi:uncharacterized protein (TIGR02611 family)